MTKTEGDRTSQYGFHLAETAADRNLFVYSNGGTVADSVETPTKATFDDPKTIEGMQFWSDLIHTHKVAPSPGFFKQGGMGGGDLFATGRLAMFVGGYWELVFGPGQVQRRCPLACRLRRPAPTARAATPPAARPTAPARPPRTRRRPGSSSSTSWACPATRPRSPPRPRVSSTRPPTFRPTTPRSTWQEPEPAGGEPQHQRRRRRVCLVYAAP